MSTIPNFATSPGSEFVSQPVFDMVEGHLNIPESSCNTEFPAAPEIPVANFDSVIGIQLPNKAPFTPHTIPTDGAINATPISPSYSEAYADIATISLVGIANSLYGDYTLPASLPEDAAGAPNLNYPEAPFETVPEDAGLNDALTAPTIVIGTVPSFYDIPEISYDLQTIEPLAYEVPETPTLPDMELLGDPGPVDHTFSPELLAAIDKALGGDEVISQQAQNILMARMQRELDDLAEESERDAFTASAEAGFSQTNGPLVSILSKIAKDASYKDRVVHENMRSEVYGRALKQVTEAIKSSLVLEAANLSMHLSYAAKLVEVLKFNVAIQAQYVDLLIEMFNQQLGAVKSVVSAYEAYVQAVLADYKAQSASIRREEAVLETNNAKVTVMGAQTKTLESQADVYSLDVTRSTQELEEFNTYVQGVLKNVNIARTNIDAFKDAIKQYSSATDSDKYTIEGYASQVRATGSATGVYEANWDAFSVAYGAASANSDAIRSWYTSSNQALTAEIGTFSTAASSQREYTQTLIQWLQANSAMFGNYASASAAEASYTKTYNAHSTSYQEAQSAIDLATEDAKVRVQALTAQAAALQASIDVGLTAAEATTAAGCAQAAYSVRSISANLRATTGMSDTGSNKISTSTSDSTTRAYAYNKTRSIEA
jgi:hypothetical protein